MAERAMPVAGFRPAAPYARAACRDPEGARRARPWLGELRMAARSRIGAHVDERADSGFLEDGDELLGAAGAVTDGEDQAAAALGSFFSVFFLEGFSSACGASSARSIRVTSARGALSPLRKPVLRMRR